MACCADGKTAVSPCVKYTVLLGALLHMFCAVGLIGVGAYAFEEKNKFESVQIEDAYDVFFNLAIVLILIGGIMFIITTCGFVGSLRENVCLLKVFYLALMIIFLAEIVGGICVIVFKDKVLDIFGGALKRVYVEEYQDDTDGVMDHFQETYKCCGIDGYIDWNDNEYYNCTATNPSPIKCSVPYSCCKAPDEFETGLINILCGRDVLTPESTAVMKIYTIGCVEQLVQVVEDNWPLVAGVLIAIAVPQLMGIFLGKRLVDQIQYQWKEYNHSRQRGDKGHRRRY